MTPSLHTRHAQSRLEISDLLRMSRRELDELFTSSPAGAIPDGEGEGILIIAPGSSVARVAAALGRLAWQGKAFDARRGRLMNRVSPLGVKAVAAEGYKGLSRFDSSIVLDYAHTSLLARGIRDEIREVAPQLYLGKAFVGSRCLLDFALRL